MLMRERRSKTNSCSLHWDKVNEFRDTLVKLGSLWRNSEVN